MHLGFSRERLNGLGFKGSSAVMKPPYLKKTVSRDPDQFLSQLFGRALAAMPVKGDFIGKLDHIDLGDVSVSFMRTSGKALFYSWVPAGRAILMLSRERGLGTNANGYFLEPDSLLTAGEQQPFGLSISGASDIAAVNLPLSSPLLNDLPGEISGQFKQLSLESKVWRSADGVRFIGELLQEMRSKIANTDDSCTERSLEAYKQSLISGIVHSVTTSKRKPQKLSASSGLYKSFVAAQSFIEPLLPAVVPVREICRGTGIRERTLQLAFRTFIDMTPGQYVRARRLAACRRALQSAYADEAIVRSIAADHGFIYPSQFSAYYKRAYGESPSATLRRLPNTILIKQRKRNISLAGLAAMPGFRLSASTA